MDGDDEGACDMNAVRNNSQAMLKRSWVRAPTSEEPSEKVRGASAECESFKHDVAKLENWRDPQSKIHSETAGFIVGVFSIGCICVAELLNSTELLSLNLELVELHRESESYPTSAYLRLVLGSKSYPPPVI
ncbi:unnamed protein product [Symbiodinium sp. CCMP2592]|nr:unnamed protein product [Symbiodinium sp. CCMP2592]